MIKNILFVFVLLLLISCGNKNEIPEGILKPEKMKLVLWDVIKAEAYTAEVIKTDTSKKATEENLKLQQQVFSIHKITRDEFYNSYDYYKNNTAAFKIMLDSMVSQGARQNHMDPKIKALQAE